MILTFRKDCSGNFWPGRSRKDAIQNDEKLKYILRPVLINLSPGFKKFAPSFLHMSRKSIKLLVQHYLELQSLLFSFVCGIELWTQES